MFERKGDNFYVKLPVTITEAALGAKVEVPTIDGPSTIKIPPGTQSGQKLRLRGKGAPSLRDSSGDCAWRRICGSASDGAERGRRAHQGNSARTRPAESGRPTQGFERSRSETGLKQLRIRNWF